MTVRKIVGAARLALLRAVIDGATQTELAARFGVSQSTISRTVNRMGDPHDSGDR